MPIYILLKNIEVAYCSINKKKNVMNTSIFTNLGLNTVIKNSSRIRSDAQVYQSVYTVILYSIHDKMANAYYNE